MAKVEEINVNGKQTEVIAFSHTAQEIDNAVDAVGIESETYHGCYYRMANGVQEWINPPMYLDKEYRLHQRYLGKPVYVKAFKIDPLPETADTFKGETHDNTIAVLDVSGTLIHKMHNDNSYYRYTLPTTDGAIIATANTTQVGVKRVTTGSFLDYKAIIVYRYIKTTD